MGIAVVFLRRTRAAAATSTFTFASLLLAAAAGAAPVTLAGGGIQLEFDEQLHSRVLAIVDGNRIELGPFSASETLETGKVERRDFAFADHSEQPVSDALGTGKAHRLVGRAGGLEKTVEVVFYDEFPRVAVLRTSWANTGPAPVHVDAWGQNQYAVQAAAGAAEPAFWSYQSGSYEKRPDWVLPLPAGFRQDNFQGMNASDYGGGHTGRGRLAPRRRPRGGSPRARAEERLASGRAAVGRPRDARRAPRGGPHPRPGRAARDAPNVRRGAPGRSLPDSRATTAT